MKVKNENWEWLKNILLSTEKLWSELKKSPTGSKWKKKSVNFYFNEYELKSKNCWKLINVFKDEDNKKILKKYLRNRKILILAWLVSKCKWKFWIIRKSTEKAEEFSNFAWTGKKCNVDHCYRKQSNNIKT